MQLIQTAVLMLLLVLASGILSEKIASVKSNLEKGGVIDKAQTIRCFESANKTEGDMIIPKGVSKRNIILDLKYKWKNNIVFYEVDASFSENDKSLVLEAIQSIVKSTCIVFKRRENEKDYVFITKPSDDGCVSKLGRVGGRQDVKLGERCMRLGIILHELLHTLGFQHQHNAHDRDEYVKIIWENIAEHKKRSFRKCSECGSYGIPYDYYSIMHYPGFNVEGKIMIETLDPSMQYVIGGRNNLSAKDIRKLKKRYKCENRKLAKRNFASQIETFVLLQVSLSCFILLSA